MKRLLIAACLLAVVSPSAQEGEAQKTRILEQRLLVIEDYLRNRLQQFEERIDAQDADLRKIGDQNASLQREVESLREKLRRAEAEILELKMNRSAVEPKKGESPAVRADSREPERQYTDERVLRLLPGLRDRSSGVRMTALVQIGKIEHPDAVQALVGALDDEDPYMRMLACKTLAQKKSKEAIDPIFSLLLSSHAELRRVACESLERITDTSPRCRPDSAGEEWSRAVQEWRETLREKR